jgi:general secretion pathway protein A
VYERFFGLNEPAFSLTPDPRLLWPSETHEEGLATLLYGITRRKGFLLLTGEVGVGKTTLLRAALEHLPEDVGTALVFNTAGLSPGDLLQMVAREFELDVRVDSKVELLYALNDFLVDRARRGVNTVLIVDEAQNLGPQLLEEVRLLSNFETNREKLLQIVLTGQPELRRTLEAPELRPLVQRIALEHHVDLLPEAAVRPYLSHRIAVAGGSFEQVFKTGIEPVFHAFARGHPRLMNVLADRVLLAAYARKLRPVTVEFMREKTEALANARRMDTL